MINSKNINRNYRLEKTNVRLIFLKELTNKHINVFYLTDNLQINRFRLQPMMITITFKYQILLYKMIYKIYSRVEVNQ